MGNGAIALGALAVAVILLLQRQIRLGILRILFNC